MRINDYHERFDQEAGAAHYAEKHSRSSLRRISSARELRCIARALDTAGASGVILDIPCGAGRARPLLERVSRRLIAADRSASMLELVRSTAPAGAAIPLFAGDAFALGLRDHSVDGVVTIRLLHHFPDAEKRRHLLFEVARVARFFLVVTFLDAGCFKQRMHTTKKRLCGRPVRRALVSRRQITAEMATLGFESRGFFALSGFFSGQTAMACRRSGKG